MIINIYGQETLSVIIMCNWESARIRRIEKKASHHLQYMFSPNIICLHIYQKESSHNQHKFTLY